MLTAANASWERDSPLHMKKAHLRPGSRLTCAQEKRLTRTGWRLTRAQEDIYESPTFRFEIRGNRGGTGEQELGET